MAFWLSLQDLECSVEDRPEMSVIHCFDPVIDPKEIPGSLQQAQWLA